MDIIHRIYGAVTQRHTQDHQTDTGRPDRCMVTWPPDGVAWDADLHASGPPVPTCLECGRPTFATHKGARAWYVSPWCEACAGITVPLQAAESPLDLAARRAGLTRHEVAEAAGVELLAPVARILDGDAGYTWSYICGEVGTGKSTQGILVALRALELGWSVRYIPEGALIKVLRQSDQAHEDLDVFIRVGLLVLDEAFSDCSTDWGADQIRRLLHERHRRAAPTVLCSNHSLAAVGEHERLGSQVQRRILQRMGGLEKLASGAGGYVELLYSWDYHKALPLPQGALGLAACQYPSNTRVLDLATRGGRS